MKNNIKEQINNQVRIQVNEQVNEQAWDQTWNTDHDRYFINYTWMQIRVTVQTQTDRQVGELIKDQMNEK